MKVQFFYVPFERQKNVIKTGSSDKGRGGVGSGRVGVVSGATALSVFMYTHIFIYVYPYF